MVQPIPILDAGPERRRHLGTGMAVLACALSTALAGWIGYVAATNLQVALAGQGLASFSSALGSLLERHEALPRVLSLNSRIGHALQAPEEGAAREAANHYLEAVAERGGVLAVFIVDREGRAIASSNWNTPESFVGHDYSFRPYFRQAMEHGTGRFYGIGSTTSRPGYYIASAVRSAERTEGLVVVKVDLASVQSSSAANGAGHAVLDEFGVVFLTSDPALRYRPLTPLTPQARAILARNQSYGSEELRAVDTTGLPEPARAIPHQLRLPGGRTAHVVAQSIGAPMDWHAVTFVDVGPAYAIAASCAVAGGAASAFLASLLAARRQRRRRAAEMQQAYEALGRGQQRMRAVADGLPFMVCFIDRDERFLFANTAYAQHRGMPAAAIEGRSVADIVSPEEHAALRPYFTRVWAGETVSFDRELGDQFGARCFEVVYRPVWNEGRTEVVGMHTVAQEVTQTRQRMDELARAAQLDHLTRLLNRKGFEARLHAALAAQHDAGRTALLCIDLDAFKPVNDTHGHAVGDALLQAFCQRLGRLVGAEHALARTGGDEFAIVLGGIAGPGVAHRLADEIARMAAQPFDLGGLTVHIGASVGVAIAAQGEPAVTLCKRADDALYAQKKQRRTPARQHSGAAA